MNTRLEIASIKYFPIFANGAMLILMLFQLLHIEVRSLVAYFVGCSLWPAINLLIQSKQMYFCSWHRILLYNTIFYASLQIASRLGIEFNYYLYVALVINLVALIIATTLYFKDGCFKRTDKRFKQNGKGVKMRNVSKDERWFKACVKVFGNKVFHNLH